MNDTYHKKRHLQTSDAAGRSTGRARTRSAGLTLIEVLMVIVVVSILVGIAMPGSRPAYHEQLKAAAQVIRSDLMMTQSEAVAMGENRSVLIDPSTNQVFFEIEKAGDYLESLPKAMAQNLESHGADTVDVVGAKIFGEGMLIDLEELPHHGVTVQILGATSAAAPNTEEPVVTYGTLGELTSGSDTTIWLGISNDLQQLYLPITINSTTGIARIGTIEGTGLPNCLSTYENNN